MAEPPIEDDAAVDPSKRVAVVVPTYNEAGNLPVLAERLFSLEMPDAWMIVVDDGSPDGTAEVARNLPDTDGWRTVLIERGRKRGLGTAYVAGFTRALELGADYIVQMDADLSHEPEYIPGLLETLGGADVVVGSRYAPGGGVDETWGVFRRMLSYTGNLGIRVITGLRVKDATAGFKAFDARVLASIDLAQLRCKGFAFQAEVAHACQGIGYRVEERPIVFRSRASGKSKMSIAIIAEALWKLLPLRWRARSRIARISGRKHIASRKSVR